MKKGVYYRGTYRYGVHRYLVGAKDEKDKKSGKYIRRERYAGSMSRSFYVGEGVTQEDIHAKYEHGVLKLSIPKKEEQKKVEKSNYIAIE